MPMPTFPPCAARRLPERAARLLHPPRRCPVRAGRRAAVRPGGPVAAHLSLEPVHRRGWGSVYAALANGRIDAERLRDLLVRAATRRPAGVRRGCDHLAALRRRVLARARLLLPPLAALGRPADHRRLGLPVDRPAQLRPRLLDRPGGRPPAAPAGRHRPDRRRADPRAAGRLPADGPVPLFVFDGGYDSAQLTLDLAEAGRGAGAAALRPLLLRRPATSGHPAARAAAAPPRRQVRLRRPDHLAGPDRHPDVTTTSTAP